MISLLDGDHGSSDIYLDCLLKITSWFSTKWFYDMSLFLGLDFRDLGHNIL